MSAELAVRFLRKVTIGEHCWEWRGSTAGRGYGTFWDPAAGMVYAHRFSYELFVGAIPEGLQIDHLCRNKRCVNPTHLEAVTQLENVQRARPEQCQHGHPFDEVNTYVDPRGYRQCRICTRARMRRRRAMA